MQDLSGDAIVAWLERAAEVMEREKMSLTELDAPIGDSDHGVNMARGFKAVQDKLGGIDRGDVGAMFKAVGMTLLSTVGGASGPLYGTLFLDAGKAAAGLAKLDLAAVTSCLEAGLAGVQRRGKAVVGDKTMVDALVPAVKALEAAKDAPLAEALHRAAEAAREGALATVPLVARKGRASYLGERSVGHKDPGATSSWLLLQCLAETAGA
ncbi:dihydroxyacetone kinase subunit DhaL [Polyangium aurulentum]|uniref:dihydroxyacetone kinase subunit DhaL n=1 Tax=Polyangium aurulentum TaxID=2567896 RepID=UPI0010AE1183|nr:dihydroxyacetone kinase subunit DhaL [Polyangium aurulentum]UQA62974.1 dihydroxyacetone kinase subunit L [Polyangium aurulentum]